MQAATWLSVVILGPGAVAVFVWFLRDVRQVLDRHTRAADDHRPLA